MLPIYPRDWTLSKNFHMVEMFWILKKEEQKRLDQGWRWLNLLAGGRETAYSDCWSSAWGILLPDFFFLSMLLQHPIILRDMDGSPSRAWRNWICTDMYCEKQPWGSALLRNMPGTHCIVLSPPAWEKSVSSLISTTYSISQGQRNRWWQKWWRWKMSIL